MSSCLIHVNSSYLLMYVYTYLLFYLIHLAYLFLKSLFAKHDCK